LAATALFCAIPISLQLSQDKVSVALDSASARVGEPLTPGSVAGVHRRVERRTARRAYYGGNEYGGYGYGYSVERRVERRMARRGYYGGYGYGMAAAGSVGTYAGGMYSAGTDSNYYPARASFTQGYVPTGYYGPVCNPSVDRLCQ
jgi:hypothetical protein